MTVAYYTHTAFFEVALSLVRELAREVQVHLILEMAPTSWQTAGFDIAARDVPPGIVPADPILRDHFPAAVRQHWQAAASFHLANYRQRRSVHPQSWRSARDVVGFARKTLGADLLHVEDVDPSPRLALAMATPVPMPLVLTVHDPIPHSGEGDWRKSLARRLAYRRANHFVLHSRTLADEFRARYSVARDSLSVVPLAPLTIFRAWGTPSAAPGGPTVLFFGRLSPYKGVDVLYEAAPIVAEAVPDVRFVIAGRPIPGYEPPAPPRLPAPANIVEIRRHVPNAELVDLFQQASVVACPYRDATQSGVALTAQGLGRAVVATCTGGIPEYVTDGETGLLCEPGDAAGLASALIRLLTDDALRDRLMANILSGRGLPDWRGSAEQLAELYGTIARR
ncbi:hypothetical protein BH23CHL7_BH23CHL7_06660 [soil metagenome]